MSPLLPVTKPIGIEAYWSGILAGLFAAVIREGLDAFGRGNLDAVIMLKVACGVLLSCLFYGLIGYLPFLALRRTTLRGSLARPAIILLVLAPVIVIWCLAAVIWLDGLWAELRPKRPFDVRLHATVTESWRGMLFAGICGGFACWAVDQRLWLPRKLGLE
jgi:hypothetical protein